MPHRVNSKGDIGTAKMFSDSYDMDNIYLTEEGWVYRHYKNSERTLWWDEIIVAGQVKPGMMIHGVENTEVTETNPLKLGTEANPVFQTGDTINDYRYSDHQGAPDKVVIETDPKPTGFDQVAWEGINVAGAVEGDLSTQVPDGWSDVSTPANVEEYPDEPPYEGDVPQPRAVYTVPVDPTPTPPPEIIVGTFEDGSGGGTAGADTGNETP
jgi:hypothetical protein